MNCQKSIVALLLLTMALGRASAAEALFQDAFTNTLGSGWSWIRENPAAWRVSERGLEVHVEPGNMWGGQNDAKNVLVRAAPVLTGGVLEISVTVSNHPAHQYEQVDLVWYYDDSNMVKLGQELVDGKLSIVMGREQKDRTRTISILPLDSDSVRLRLEVGTNHIVGWFRSARSNDWVKTGECDLPAPTGVTPKISLQFYQGPGNIEHWARVSDLVIQAR